ncbi:conjugal transfer nickase/helicase domain-containing protein [Pseudomonas grimontii]|uniref:Putative conjugal transfer nickase/helicase TraI C-terminal domain-containing protein n=1 Tax=Pseudomonas grimontii TaxID=129847 RepID=A0A5C5PDV8_9PSED|nr:hypothetical protein FIV39_19970 [Pseudomonas grimontii]
MLRSFLVSHRVQTKRLRNGAGVQTQFKKLKVHRKHGDDINIWTFQVEGSR